MADTDTAGNPIGPTTGTTIAKAWGDAVAERVVAIYADATERDLLELAPATGRTIYVEDVEQVQAYDGSAWDALATIHYVSQFASDQAELVRVYRSTTLAVASGSVALATFNAEEIDDWGGHSTISNPSRISDSGAGLYHAELQVTFETNATGYRQCEIWQGSGLRTAMSRQSAISGDSTIIRASTVLYLDGSEYVEAKVYQDSGVSLDLLTGNGVSWFALAKMATLV